MLRYRLLHLLLLVLVGLAIPARAGSPLRAPVMLQDIRIQALSAKRATPEELAEIRKLLDQNEGEKK